MTVEEKAASCLLVLPRAQQNATLTEELQDPKCKLSRDTSSLRGVRHPRLMHHWA